ncbi:hypothetical protein [Halosimplex pelagicum]|uniref:Uncharacterized protein n=1 Tax=Halosimplex pelagicum TaxID=869886 RepID=A0A7D5PB10_9EURY|nr:hypothetical protein [Halosimplex pelagicum]QLH83424.1 hypothetical protein HZS54_18090 [Halosimplex pelagicum]
MEQDDPVFKGVSIFIVFIAITLAVIILRPAVACACSALFQLSEAFPCVIAGIGTILIGMTIYGRVGDHEDNLFADIPEAWVTCLLLVLAGLLLLEFYMDGGLNNQIYGLAIDGVGAIILASESGTLYAKESDWALGEDAWGAGLLLIGFILQVLHLFPWGSLPG